MTSRTYTTREISALGATLGLWLWLSVGAALLNMAAAGVELWLLNQIPSNRAVPPGGDIPGPVLVTALTAIARLPVLVVIVVTGFLFLKWIYRASRNAHALSSGLTTPPPWAVGWFFVPVAFLWVPFGAFSETWRASHQPEGWKATSVPSLLRWWWGFWLAENFLGQASLRLAARSETIFILSGAVWMDILGSLASLAATLAAIVIVRRLTAVQTRRIEERAF